MIFYAGDVAGVVHLVFGIDDARGNFETEAPRLLGRDQPLLDHHRHRANGAMAAHRQAAGGLDEEDRGIDVVAQRRIDDRAAHHVVACAAPEHQTGSDPVELGEEVLAPGVHRVALEVRPAAGDHPHRIAGGMRVDAEETFPAHGKSD